MQRWYILGALLFLHLLLPITMFAQTKVWDKTIGGKESDFAIAIRQTPDGGYIVGGQSESGISDDKSEVNIGERDYWVVKLKPDGTKEWDQTIGGTGEDRLVAIQVTRDGGYIVGGTSSSGISGDKSEARRGGDDFWIVKLKPDGTKEWDKTYGGSGSWDILFDLQQTRDGGYILGGRSNSGISGDKTQKNKGSEDYWIVKIKADGSKEWDKSFGGGGVDILTSLQQTQDGGYLLGGNSQSGISSDKSEGNVGCVNNDNFCTDDYWVIKINAHGIKEWDKTFGGAENDLLTSVLQTSDGSYIIGGYSNSDKSGEKSEDRNGPYNFYNPDYWVLKLRPDGTKVWDKNYGAPKTEYLEDIYPTREGGFILGGTSYSDIGGDKTEPNRYVNTDENTFEYPDYWLVKITADGTIIWDKTLGGNAQDELVSLQQTFDGGYILAGGSSSGISGDKTQPVKNGFDHDFWVVKVAENPYCEPVSNYDCTTGFFINSFSLHTLVNNNSGCNEQKGSYLNYTPIGTLTSTLQAGESYPVALQGGQIGAQNFGIWLDLNNDQDFDDAGEFIFQSGASTGKTITGSLTIPANLEVGLYRLRVRTNHKVYDGVFTSDQSCSPVDFGETEDYTIQIENTNPDNNAALWNYRYGGAGDEGLLAVVKTADGGYLTGGYSPSGNSGDKTQTSQGHNDYWIVKTDAAGQKQWDKTFGGPGNDYLNRVVQTPDGGYLLAGSSFSGAGGDKTQASRGDRDYWVVKISSTGSKEWDQRYGGSGADELKKVVTLPSGEYLLAGFSNSPANGDKSQSSRGGTDYWVVKISSAGTKIWDKRYGGSLNETLTGIVATANGGFLLGGSSASGKNGDKSQVSRGSSDYWLVRLDENGTQLWDRSFGGTGADEAYSLGRIGNEYYLAGQSNSPAGNDKTQASQGNTDYWLVKVNSTGNKLWDQTFGGNQDEELRASIPTQDGGYLLAGRSFSGVSGTKTQPSQGKSDYWLVKLDPAGAYQWDARFGGAGTEELRAVTQATDGTYVLAGRTYSEISGDKTQPSQGGSDFWLVKVAPPISAVRGAKSGQSAPVLENAPAFNLLKAAPNPFSERVKINFTLPQTQTATLKVYDSQGREITTLFQGEAKAKQRYQVEWQANKQAAGLYFLQLQTPILREQQKLILTK